MESHILLRKRLWLFALAGLVMIFLVLPTLIVVPMSFTDSQFMVFPPTGFSLRWYRAYLNSAEWMSSTWVSVKVGLASSILATCAGTAAAYGLRRMHPHRPRIIVIMLLAPILVPVILLAVGVFYVYARIGLLDSLSGLVLAHSAMAVPLVLIVMLARFVTYDMNHERVAQNLGATRLQAFFLVTLPQIRFSVCSAALLAFLSSFDEVIVAMFITRGETSTITRRMFTTLRDQIDPSIAAISTILIALTVAVVLASRIVERRS